MWYDPALEIDLGAWKRELKFESTAISGPSLEDQSPETVAKTFGPEPYYRTSRPGLTIG